MGEVKLIGTTTSLLCTRIEWALRLKGVEYEFFEEDLRNKSPLLKRYNPVHQKVPVLVHDGRPVAESLVILEYNDDTWRDRSPLMPQDPYEKAMARFWAKLNDDKGVHGAWHACWAEGEEKEKAMESVKQVLSFLEKLLVEGNQEFYGGENIGFLDLAIGWISLWLGCMEEAGGGMELLSAENFPSLHKWAQDFIQIPVIKQCLPQREKLVDHFHTSLSYFRSLAANKE